MEEEPDDVDDLRVSCDDKFSSERFNVGSLWGMIITKLTLYLSTMKEMKSIRITVVKTTTLFECFIVKTVYLREEDWKK